MNTALKIAGTAVGVLAGFLTAVWEIFLSPLYAGRVPLPVSPVLAVVSTVAVIWFTRRVTGSVGLSLLPGVVWFAVMIFGAKKTAEGDLLMPSTDWMGLLTILAGALAWGVYAYRMILASRPDLMGPAPAPRPPTPAGAQPVKAAPPKAAPSKAAPSKAASPKSAAPKPAAAKQAAAKQAAPKPAAPKPVPGAKPAGGRASGQGAKPAGGRASAQGKNAGGPDRPGRAN